MCIRPPMLRSRFKKADRFHQLVLLLAVAAGLPSWLNGAEKPGHDLLPIFGRAQAGEPLRAVAVGTSFTQGGGGWIGGWLKEQFPGNSYVSLRNSGMSAMGLIFHTFRLARDVVDFQPNLVLLESGPNDADLDNEGVLRYLESIVVRLKSLENPPAIVIIDSSGRNTRVNRQVAEHYGLLNVDVNQALQAEYARDPAMKTRLTIPDGHPSKQGNAFFRDQISAALQPFVEEARSKRPLAGKTTLPPPLSKKPLLLDARLVQLTPEMAEGWNLTSNPAEAQRRIYLGTLSSTTPGAQITIPVRGTALGIFYALQKNEYGRFYAGLDGNPPREIDTAFRGGYSFAYFGDDLAATEHLIRIVLPRSSKALAPVHLGYLMVAGDHGCSQTLARQGPYDVAKLRSMSFRPLSAENWWWTGPFAAEVADTLAAFRVPYSPESAKEKEHLRGLLNGGPSSKWRQLAGDGDFVDFENATGLKNRGVCYAATTLWVPEKREVLARVIADYYCQAWINDKEVLRVDYTHGSASNTLPIFPVELRAGENQIVVKLAAGGWGNRFSLSLTECDDAAIGPKR